MPIYQNSINLGKSDNTDLKEYKNQKYFFHLNRRRLKGNT